MTRDVADVFRRCEQEILALYHWNPWFLNEYWPMNRPRLVRMLGDVVRLRPPGDHPALIDVGCGTGYMSYVFAKVGYAVTGVDGYPDEQRDRLFGAAGVGYVDANFNAPDPLRGVPSGGYDVLLCGEVIEHILNHPQGFADELGRVIRTGGHAVVTTPNPSTVMNAVRLLRDRYSLWGTGEFVATPKFAGGAVISRGDIHYREYTTRELTGMLDRAGFEVTQVAYLGAGPNARDGRLKRAVKRLPVIRGLSSSRLFGATHYQIARKRA